MVDIKRLSHFTIIPSNEDSTLTCINFAYANRHLSWMSPPYPFFPLLMNRCGRGLVAPLMWIVWSHSLVYACVCACNVPIYYMPSKLGSGPICLMYVVNLADDRSIVQNRYYMSCTTTCLPALTCTHMSIWGNIPIKFRMERFKLRLSRKRREWNFQVTSRCVHYILFCLLHFTPGWLCARFSIGVAANYILQEYALKGKRKEFHVFLL